LYKYISFLIFKLSQATPHLTIPSYQRASHLRIWLDKRCKCSCPRARRTSPHSSCCLYIGRCRNCHYFPISFPFRPRTRTHWTGLSSIEGLKYRFRHPSYLFVSNSLAGSSEIVVLSARNSISINHPGKRPSIAVPSNECKGSLLQFTFLKYSHSPERESLQVRISIWHYCQAIWKTLVKCGQL